MKLEEKKLIEQLIESVNRLSESNAEFQKSIKSEISIVKQETEKIYKPFNLEQEILQSAQKAVGESIIKVLTSGYDSPLTKLVKLVVDENSVELKQIISDSFTQVIRKEEFKASILNAFSHKVARTIISNNDGMFDKVSNELKQDVIFKSKMALAVSNVVNECLIERSK